MAPKANPRVVKAFRAMKELGLGEDVVKPVLKNLLKVYDKNWAYIEDENYRVLVDAIFESEDDQKRKPTDNDVPHETEQPLKRFRPSHEDQDISTTEDANATSCGTSLQGENLYHDTALADIELQPLQAVLEPSELAICNINSRDDSEPESPPTSLRQRDRRLTSSKALAIVEASEAPLPCRSNEALHFSQMGIEDSKYPSDKERTYSERYPQLLYSNDPEMEPHIIPEAVADTCTLIKPKTEPEVSDIPYGGLPNTVFQPETANEMYITDTTSIAEDNKMDSLPLMEVGISKRGKQTGNDTEEEFVRVCNSANEVIQSEYEKLTFYYSENGIANAVSPLPEDLAISGRRNGLCTSVHHDEGGTTHDFIESVKEKEATEMPHSINTDKLNYTEAKKTTYLLDVSDITKGEEKLKISIVNHFNEVPLPSFCYIPQSLVGQNAVVSVSLAQISKEDCCSNCVGDCLSLKASCNCACTTGERCMYASGGILKEDFLEESISMTRNPQKHKQFFCEDCPLEIGTDTDILKPCQGHLVRKAVNECWLRCHCSKNCTNRRVQRGINYKLQVFMTSAGKGWGLRTLEDLPKGAFVCEFVGEILTLSEFYLRYQSDIRNCPSAMVLDAGWASLKELKADKDKALCLDASVYGNVARFINHRCTDANLVAIPTRVETPDHHYHRIAFFTSRKVAALEELTREYGIKFDVSDSLTKPFRCRCGSSFCRNIKQYNRKRVR